MKNYKIKVIYFLLLSIFAFSCSEEKKETIPPIPVYDVPQVYITTPNGEKIKDKENWIKKGNILVVDRYDNVRLDVQSDFKGRGNSTWMMPKKP